MSVSAGLRKEVWNSMLRAEMNAIYWGEMVRRAYNKDRVCKFFLLATSSTTVAGWKFWQDYDFLWKGLSVISALLAIALPIINWAKNVADGSNIRGKWLQLARELSNLRVQIASGQRTETEIQGIYDALTTKEAAVSTEETPHRINQKARQEAFDEVLKTRGLKRTK